MQPDSMILKLFKTSLFQALLASAVVLTAGGIVRGEDAQPAKVDESPWWDSKWPTRKQITIDAGDKGVLIAEPIGTTAVLVRLHDGNLNFLGAKEDGSDVRFVADDGKMALKHHIEKWDALLNEAYVWVQVPELKPSAATNIWLYYGNTADTTPAAAAKETFDGDTTLVFHFANTISASTDSSASGVKAEGVPPPAAGSLVAGGLRLLGQTAVTVPAVVKVE